MIQIVRAAAQGKICRIVTSAFCKWFEVMYFKIPGFAAARAVLAGKMPAVPGGVNFSQRPEPAREHEPWGRRLPGGNMGRGLQKCQAHDSTLFAGNARMPHGK